MWSLGGGQPCLTRPQRRLLPLLRPWRLQRLRPAPSRSEPSFLSVFYHHEPDRYQQNCDPGYALHDPLRRRLHHHHHRLVNPLHPSTDRVVDPPPPPPRGGCLVTPRVAFPQRASELAGVRMCLSASKCPQADERVLTCAPLAHPSLPRPRLRPPAPTTRRSRKKHVTEHMRCITCVCPWKRTYTIPVLMSSLNANVTWPYITLG